MSKLELRPYQKEGVKFLVGRGAALLADQPGLGKTIQTISAMKEMDEWRILILCPKSMIYVWKEEIEKWDVDAEAHVITGSYLEKKRSVIDNFASGDQTRKYFITNWETLSQKKQLPLENLPWSAVVGDEIHKIKNRRTAVAKNLKKITNSRKKKVRKYGLSGTPFTKSADELWSILNWFDPKRWSSYWKFVNTYMVVENRPWGKEITRQKDDFKLKQDIMPWVLQRLKKDVLRELPEKQYQHIWTDISKVQYDMYMTMKEDFYAEFGDVFIDAPDILSQLTRFRQLVVSPAVLDSSLPDDSPRLDAVVEYVVNYGQPVVIFSNYVATLGLLEKRLAKENIPTWTLHGGISAKDRNTAKTEFQGHTGAGAFLSTISAGGVGITLHNASTVLFVDRDWSPAINGQAEDRVHRMGQRNAVNVVSFGIPQTIDMRVLKILNDKSKEFNKIFASDALGIPPKPGKVNVR